AHPADRGEGAEQAPQARAGRPARLTRVTVRSGSCSRRRGQRVRAVQVVRLDGPGAVEVRDLPEPQRGPDQVLVDVRAIGVNFPVVLQTKWLFQYRPAPTVVLGAVVAG